MLVTILFNFLGLGDMNSITSLSEEKEDLDGKSSKPKYMYIMSGAEGYIDFRIGIIIFHRWFLKPLCSIGITHTVF